MAVLLVTYDLKRPARDYSGLLDAIRAYPWARLSESSYAIATDQVPEVVYAQLRPHIDSNDNIYIISLRRPHMGYGPKEVNDWLERNLFW